MFPRQYRLKKKKDFEGVYKKGKTISNEYFLFKFIENDLENPRIGIIVSRRVLNKAVKRNLLKRRIREAIRNNFPEKNIDLVIIARKNIENYQEIETLIKQFYERLY